MHDCDAVSQALTEGATPAEFPPPLASHLRDCSSCRHLTSIDRSLKRTPPGDIPQGPALLAALDRDMAPVRYRPVLQRAALRLGAVAAVTLSGATMLGRPTAATALPWAAAMAMLTVAGAGVALVLYRGASGLGAPVGLRRGYMVGASLLFVTSAVATTQGTPWTLRPASPMAHHMGVSALNAVTVTHDPSISPMQNLGTCASTGLVFAGVVALGLLWSTRRTVPVSSGSMGTVVGAAAGLAAAAALQLSCATHVGHALVAHGLPMALAMVLCTFLGRRALAP